MLSLNKSRPARGSASNAGVRRAPVCVSLLAPARAEKEEASGGRVAGVDVVTRESKSIPAPAYAMPPFATPVAPPTDADANAAPWVPMPVSVVVETLTKKQRRLRLLMALVAESTGAVTPFSVVVGAGSTLNPTPYVDDDSATAGANDPSAVGRRLLSGTMLSGSVQVPADFGAVGAVLLRVEKEKGKRKGNDDGGGDEGDEDEDDEAELYVADVRLVVPGEEKAAQDDVHVRSYLMPPQGTRVFFSRRASIPQSAPKALAPYREGDLAVLRGDYVSLDRPDLVPQTPYKSHDRVYQYDVYNDLGRPNKLDGERTRPTLGGEGCIPYPRRLCTGRAITASGEEIAPKGDAYLPRNEQFTKKAAQDFVRSAGISTASGFLKILNVRAWDDFAEAVDWFSDEGSLLQKLFKALRKRLVASAGVDWSVPRVLDGRLDAWQDDAEFGRQIVAGQNPVAVQAATRDLLARTSFSVLGREQLGGATLEELAAERDRHPVRGARLFMVDFATPTILEYAEKVNAAEKSGEARLVGTRCLLLSGEDRVLRPVAIELVRSRNEPGQLVTPADGAALWLMAKMYVASSDSGHHQLISHWLKCHACSEPYIIAAKRCLSQAHPLMRFLSKHFYYTLQINAKARGNLINRDGVVEISFTPGARCLELSAAAYRDGWSFEGEALPADLLARGMAVGDASLPGGAGVRLVDAVDYPYAEDGLALWKIIEDWTTEFVAIYYPDDAAVAADPELAAFWMEVTTVGHGDIERGWPALTSVQSLARCLTTIVYQVSAFHAAINFAQYDFAGTLLNRPSRTRLDFPRPGEPAFAELSCAPGAGISRAQEKLIMAHLADPNSYMRIAAVINTLSTHDQAEHYLGAPDPWMVDPSAPAVESLYREFGRKLKAFEATVAARNADRNNAARCGGGVLDYRLLLPSSPPGMTSQGVPNSVSI